MGDLPFSKSEKESLFWEIFDALVLKSPDKTVKGQDLQDSLVCSGRFYTSDAYWIIQEMARAGKLETTGFNTYRRTDRNK